VSVLLRLLLLLLLLSRSALFCRLFAFGERGRKPEVVDPGFDDDAVCADDDYDADQDDADKSGGAGDADDE
jgi:hypothetical protein